MQQYSNWSTYRFIILAFFSSHYIIVQTVMPHKWQKKVIINGINEAKKKLNREKFTASMERVHVIASAISGQTH